MLPLQGSGGNRRADQLLAEDLENGTVALGSGQLVLFAAIGAGVHYGAHLVRL